MLIRLARGEFKNSNGRGRSSSIDPERIRTKSIGALGGTRLSKTVHR